MFVSSLILLAIAYFNVGKTESISDWLNKGEYGDFSKTIELGANSTGNMLSLLNDEMKYTIVFPTNDAWKDNEALYNEIVNGNKDIYNLLTIITVEDKKFINNIGEFNPKGLTNMKGQYIMHTQKGDKHYLSIGELNSDDKFVPLTEEPSIEIEDKPRHTFDNIVVYATSKFHLPDEVFN